MDAFERKNQMAVLSNTTSEEDYAKMQEEGFPWIPQIRIRLLR